MTTFRYSLTSDLALDEDFSIGLSTRSIDQRYMYQGESAKHFCNLWENKAGDGVPSPNELADSFKKHISKEKCTAIVSIGCGDASLEKEALDEVISEGYQVAYFGVDISRDMLGLASDTMKNAEYPVHLIFGDFMAPNFSSEMPKLLREYDSTIFLFLGSTLGNVSQSAAIDCLYNLMKKGEKLFLEVGVCPSLSSEDTIRIFKRGRERLSNQEYMKTYFYQLKTAGIPYENGRMYLETTTEATAGVVKITFGFEITTKTIIEYRGQTLHLLPLEKIKLLDIRMYSPEDLLRFVTEHDFTLLESLVKERRGLFIFEK